MTAAMALGACGAASPEALAESAIEKGLEAEGIENVELDSETGDLSMTLGDEDGNKIVVETGKELPDWWPSDQSLPDGAVIVRANRVDNDGSVVYSVVFEGPSDSFDAFHEHILANNTGRNMTTDFVNTSVDGTTAVLGWGTSSQVEVSATLGTSADGTVGSITVFEE